MEVAAMSRAPARTGRRPRWSESAPVVSRASNKARAYALKTTVAASAERPHWP